MRTDSPWVKLIIALCSLLVLLAIKFTFNISITQNKVTEQVVATQEVAAADKPVKKPGKLTEAQCYSIAKNHDDWTKHKIIDTYGFPKGEDDTILGVNYRMSDAESKWYFCSIDFDLDDKVEHVTIDLYYNDDL